MIYKALFDLAEREGLLTDTAYEPQEVHYLVHIGANGEYLGCVAPRDEAAEGGKRSRSRAKRRLVPRRSGRTSGDRPEFLVDKAEYVFGIDPSGERAEEEIRGRQRMFIESIETALEKLPHKSSLKALRDFLVTEVPAEIRQLLSTDKAADGTALVSARFGFVYEPDGGIACIHDDAEVKGVWLCCWTFSRGSRTRGCETSA